MRVRLIGLVMMSVLMSVLAGCVAAPPGPPPPEQAADPASSPPAPPATKQVWVKAGWHRNGDDYVWVKAHYVTVRVRHRHWVHEHRTPNGTLIPAHWET